MISKADLVGSWHLESWTVGYPDRDDITAPFGDDPRGLLLYTEDDWMSAAICAGGRRPFPEPATPRAQSDQVLAEAFKSYFHYAGRYEVRDGDVVHYVTQHIVPNLVGSEQLRHAELDGHTLVLSGKEEFDGQVRYHSLVWHRYGVKDSGVVIDA
jgi:hypothetical protein